MASSEAVGYVRDIAVRQGACISIRDLLGTGGVVNSQHQFPGFGPLIENGPRRSAVIRAGWGSWSRG